MDSLGIDPTTKRPQLSLHITYNIIFEMYEGESSYRIILKSSLNFHKNVKDDLICSISCSMEKSMEEFLLPRLIVPIYRIVTNDMNNINYVRGILSNIYGKLYELISRELVFYAINYFDSEIILPNELEGKSFVCHRNNDGSYTVKLGYGSIIEIDGVLYKDGSIIVVEISRSRAKLNHLVIDFINNLLKEYDGVSYFVVMPEEKVLNKRTNAYTRRIFNFVNCMQRYVRDFDRLNIGIITSTKSNDI